MKSRQLSFWPDGEKIPDEDVVRIFRPPPEIPDSFSRSALIVGAKGVGKTTLFRYQKAIHQGVGIHLNLATELSSLPRQASLGPLARQAFGVPSELVANKVCSLLALSITSRLFRKKVFLTREAVVECIPPILLGKMPRRMTEKWLSEVKVRISRAGLTQFQAVPLVRPLVEFACEAAAASLQADGPLLLLLDRADLVSPLTLVPIIQLLDQSPGYTALVATRPGHGSSIITGLDHTISAGDQYDVYNLGRRPFTKQWADFVYDALAAQFGEDRLSPIGRNRLDAVIALSRDSIRLALEAVARVASTQGKIEDEMINALADLKELYTVAVQTHLSTHRNDYRGLMTSVRKEVLEKAGKVQGPMTLNIVPEIEPTLFPEPTRLSLFIEAALRSAGLCMPEGHTWVPGSCPTTLEVPPLLLWQQGDLWWSYADAQRCEPVNVREQDILRLRGGPPAIPSIFIAYRIKSDASKHFREALEREIVVHPRLSRIDVKDGKVPIGTEDWAEEIRRRIRTSNLVVGDCTGMRPEVLFELGFAYGLGTPVLPVVEAGTCSDLPYWLRRSQVGEFKSGLDLGDLLASIEGHLADPSLKSRRGNPPPVPRLTVWLRPTDWTTEAVEQFRTLAQREGVPAEIYTHQSPPLKILERATVATFLIVTLDGTDWDAFGHYICGAVVARPEAGYGGKKIARRVVVVEPPTAKEKEFTAEGLSRCEETVIVTKPQGVRDMAKTFFDALRQWSREPKS